MPDPRRGGGPARKPPKGRGRAPDPRSSARAAAQAIVDKNGLPWPLAVQVANGKITLNEAIARLAREAKARRIETEHGIQRSLAVQVAMGQAALDEVLLKQRLKEHLSVNGNRSVLVECAANGQTVGLALHGQRRLDGTVDRVDDFEFVLATAEGAQTIHKLQVKFATVPGEWKLHKKGIGSDPARARPSEPLPRPQDRYPCSDRRLFGLLDARKSFDVTTLEGDVLRGQMTWLGRWEFGMTLKGGATAVVFRHAMAELVEA